MTSIPKRSTRLGLHTVSFETKVVKAVLGNEALVQFIGKNMPGVNVYGLNPGLIHTEIRDNYLGHGIVSSIVEGLITLTCQSAQDYAENVLVHLMVSPEFEDKSQINFENNGAILPVENPYLTENYNLIIENCDALVKKALSNSSPASQPLLTETKNLVNKKNKTFNTKKDAAIITQ